MLQIASVIQTILWAVLFGIIGYRLAKVEKIVKDLYKAFCTIGEGVDKALPGVFGMMNRVAEDTFYVRQFVEFSKLSQIRATLIEACKKEEYEKINQIGKQYEIVRSKLKDVYQLVVEESAEHIIHETLGDTY